MESILLKNGRVIDVAEKKIEQLDIAVVDGKIEVPGKTGSFDREIDLKGSYVCPGLIDGHIHIESSMLTPVEFSRKAVLRGTTSVFVDPHEIANVLGRKGVELFMDIAEELPLTMYIGVPSCVPATDLETSGGSITLKDVEELLQDRRVYGLAEMMNFPGILHGVGDAREKVEAALKMGKVVDGHCPGLSGEDLSAYISNGKDDWAVRIGSDHECVTPDEALEKWEKGMYIMLRSGSSSRDLENILPEVAEKCPFLDKFGLVSDDLSAHDLVEKGHVDRLVRTAARILKDHMGIGEERAFIEAVAMASLNHANYFKKDTGQIRPGAVADIIVFDSLEDLKPRMVISRGRIVVEGGELAFDMPVMDISRQRHDIILPEGLEVKLQVRTANASEKVRVMTVRPGTLITGQETVQMFARDGILDAMPEKGILRLSVIERHKGTGNVANCFVSGFPLKRGAIASTVAHDSHNLVVLGTDAENMAKAARALKNTGGGFAAVNGTEEKVLPLGVGGLMSARTAEEVLEEHIGLMEFLTSMGVGEDPFPGLSFVALPVIPSLKLTDKGLVDVEKFEMVELFI